MTQGGEPDDDPSRSLNALAPDVEAQVNALVAAFVDDVLTSDIDGDAFRGRVTSVAGIGAREIATTSQMSRRFLDRPLHGLRGSLGAKSPLAKDLAELRRIFDNLDPERRLLASVDAATGARTPARRPRSRATRGGAGDERTGGDPRGRGHRQDARDQPADRVRDRDRGRAAGPGAGRHVHRQGRGRDGGAAALPRAAGRDGADVPRARAEPAAPLLAVAPRRRTAPATARLQDPDPRPARAPAARPLPVHAGEGPRGRDRMGEVAPDRSARVRARGRARRSGPRAADPGRPLHRRLRGLRARQGPPGPHRLRRPPRRDRAPARGRCRRRRDRPRPQALVQRRRVPGHEPAPAAAARAVARATARTCASSATSTRRSTRSPARHRTT